MKSTPSTIVGLTLVLALASAGCSIILIPLPFFPPPAPQSSPLKCQECHDTIYTKWSVSAHGNTQADVAGELAEERAGQAPGDVLHGDDAENCIACHGPTATLAIGGMSEARALSYFFSTINGRFTADTDATHAGAWPDIDCTACHDVPDDHPASMPSLALFDSRTGTRTTMDNASQLCGQCHGDLRFADTDHLTYNAWSASKHAETQADVASELAEERADQTPEDVVHGDDPENCIACHAPTAVLANGKMTETEALQYFFITEGGTFTADTAPAHTAEWPSVSCTACHDPMAPGSPAYFNSTTKTYEPMVDSGQLCGQCHGSLRFPDTDHLSFDILAGTGGVGVPDQQTMPGVTCTDCHMFTIDVDGSNAARFHGHSFEVTVGEADGGRVAACTTCHETIGAGSASAIITGWKADFDSRDAEAQSNVAAAAAAMDGVENDALQAKLDEAQFNLAYAESDESGGCHNHRYLTALLNDANDKALEILTDLGG